MKMLGIQRCNVFWKELAASLAVVFFGLLPSVSNCGEEDQATKQKERDHEALKHSPSVERLAKDIAPIIKEIARTHAESSAKRAASVEAVTSRDRPRKGEIASTAHNRGAEDVVTKNMSEDAKKISKEVGPGYVTIHEKPEKDKDGKRVDRHTSYVMGEKTNERTTSPRATAEHVHIQPEFNKQLQGAVDGPPSTKKQTEATINSTTNSSNVRISTNHNTQRSAETSRSSLAIDAFMMSPSQRVEHGEELKPIDLVTDPPQPGLERRESLRSQGSKGKPVISRSSVPIELLTRPPGPSPERDENGKSQGTDEHLSLKDFGFDEPRRGGSALSLIDSRSDQSHKPSSSMRLRNRELEDTGPIVKLSDIRRGDSATRSGREHIERDKPMRGASGADCDLHSSANGW